MGSPKIQERSWGSTYRLPILIVPLIQPQIKIYLHRSMAFPSPSQSSITSLPLPDPEAYTGEPREYARALMQRKDAIESEMVS